MAPPSDLSFSGLVLPPLFVAAVVGCLLAVVVARLATRFGLDRYVWHPWLVFVALAVLFTTLIGLSVVPSA